jgi:hypothetical protein
VGKCFNKLLAAIPFLPFVGKGEAQSEPKGKGIPEWEAEPIKLAPMDPSRLNGLEPSYFDEVSVEYPEQGPAELSYAHRHCLQQDIEQATTSRIWVDANCKLPNPLEKDQKYLVFYDCSYENAWTMLFHGDEYLLRWNAREPDSGSKQGTVIVVGNGEDIIRFKYRSRLPGTGRVSNMTITAVPLEGIETLEAEGYEFI